MHHGTFQRAGDGESPVPVQMDGKSLRSCGLKGIADSIGFAGFLPLPRTHILKYAVGGLSVGCLRPV